MFLCFSNCLLAEILNSICSHNPPSAAVILYRNAIARSVINYWIKNKTILIELVYKIFPIASYCSTTAAYSVIERLII